MTKRQTAGKKVLRIPPSKRRNRIGAADIAASGPSEHRPSATGLSDSERGQRSVESPDADAAHRSPSTYDDDPRD